MAKSIDIQTLVIQGLAINGSAAIFKPYIDEEGIDYKYFWTLDGEDEASNDDVNYIIYDCSNEMGIFDIDAYRKVIEENLGDSLYSPVIIFENLDSEYSMRDQIYSTLRKADKKKEFNKFFDEKISLYADSKAEITIEVEERGVNYLEYKPHNINIEAKDYYLEGYIYNVSYFQLKKILNVTGKRLFKENIRVGLENNRTGKKLKKEFKNYILVGLYYELLSKQNEKEKIMEILALNEDIICKSSPEKFWFYHNGVTIFSYDMTKKINRSNNQIKLNPNKISIINGAQTLTNLYSAIHELNNELPKKISDLDFIEGNVEEWVNDKLNQICKNIQLKTIIIDGSAKYVNKISIGLNTQIPIDEKDIIAVTEEVDKINSSLKKGFIKISRDGEKSAEANLSVIEFAKKYLMIIGQPGKSKNLNKTELRTNITNALEEVNKPDFIPKLNILIELDKWWKSTRNPEAFLNDENISNDEYFKYGKNYFGSYLLRRLESEIDEENFYNLFNLFVKEFHSIKNNVGIEDFKNDELFKKYIANVETQNCNKVKSILEINCSEIYQYVNEHKKNNYTISNTISDYLISKRIDISYFRVIAIANKKVKEAYPFPNKTFSQLYQEKSESDNVTKLTFEQSLFKQEVDRKFPVFIVVWEGYEKGMVMKSIEFIPEFSFVRYEANAETVFNITKNAFEVGDESLFTKSSENIDFHIRPKGTNADDTFEFSNGIQITKRTFWANKEIIKELIKEFMTESGKGQNLFE